MEFVVTSADRVTAVTPKELNRRIRRDTDARVAWLAHQGAHAIATRLEELDREWDIERWLATGAGSLTLAGTVLGLAADDRRWLLLPIGVGGFLLQHALQGWCPPLSLLRRLGVRTADEINVERFALKALRGDFADLSDDDPGSGRRALEAARH